MKIIFTVLFSFTILLSAESSVLASPRELKQTSAIWRGGYVGFNIGNRIINYEYSHVTNTDIANIHPNNQNKIMCH